MDNKKIEEQIKSAVYVTVGAATIMLEKAKELINEFELKGKETCEAHKVENEELKRKIQEALKKVVDVKIVKEETTDEFIEKMDSLSEEEIVKIKEKLEAIEKAKAKAPSKEEPK